MESFNYGSAALAVVVVVIWPFHFFGAQWVSFFGLSSRFALTLCRSPGAGQLKQTSSALVQLRILVNFGQNFAERVRLAPDNTTPQAPYTAFSQKSTHFTNLGHHSLNTSLEPARLLRLKSDLLSEFCWDIQLSTFVCWDCLIVLTDCWIRVSEE